WTVDGRSLLVRGRPFPSRSVLGSVFGPPVKASWRVVNAGRARTIARKTRLFGAGNAPLLVLSGTPGHVTSTLRSHRYATRRTDNAYVTLPIAYRRAR